MSGSVGGASGADASSAADASGSVDESGGSDEAAAFKDALNKFALDIAQDSMDQVNEALDDMDEDEEDG